METNEAARLVTNVVHSFLSELLALRTRNGHPAPGPNPIESNDVRYETTSQLMWRIPTTRVSGSSTNVYIDAIL